ncbi:MAG TPA: DNA-3-methyladenine glycosylase I [Pseudosphingobacterium sp.]|jgi:DNA-3-methyladenine glycosylase I|nr:DNA-3-methyladenine glycosylase I [Pseudosphingobacterium sp.]
MTRCGWCGNDPLYMAYHDKEWGKKVTDDKTLFEFLILESAQAGLSWITILRKREGYKQNFADFNVEEVANFREEDINRIMLDSGIIRNRAKVKAAITNAQIFKKIQGEYGSFFNYLYSFMPNNEPISNYVIAYKNFMTTSPQSDAIAKDLKKRGMKFFGSTICYAYMQAVGMVNDHEESCSFK